VLTFLGFLGTVLLLRWDTWVQGAAEESVGDNQRMLIYAGGVTTVVFGLVAIFDAMRAIGPGDTR
jgi:hypothetical protein